MEVRRKPFQGVLNIIRFNWHFYALAGVILIFVAIFNNSLPKTIQSLMLVATLCAVLPIIISLLVSFYIYDLFGLYQLKWISDAENKKILNVNAGFDETSEIIMNKFPTCELSICDFYNPQKHTEVSIKRARQAYPSLAQTIQVSTCELPFQDNSFDYILTTLSAHEIRDEHERITFFKEIKRILKPNGQVFVTEHLRDMNNFLVYTIGFLHFHTKSSWVQTFEQAGLKRSQEIKNTPFITTFILTKNGTTF